MMRGGAPMRLLLVNVCVCVCASVRAHTCWAHLAVLGTVGGGLASRAHERLLHRLVAVPAQRGIALTLARNLRPGHLVPLGTFRTRVKRQAPGPTEMPTVTLPVLVFLATTSEDLCRVCVYYCNT